MEENVKEAGTLEISLPCHATIKLAIVYPNKLQFTN